MGIKKGETYGDFRVVDRESYEVDGETKYKYRCICNECGRKVRYKEIRLQLEPDCICQTPTEPLAPSTALSTEVIAQRNKIEKVKSRVYDMLPEGGYEYEEEEKSETVSMFESQVDEISENLNKAGDKLDAQTQFQLQSLKMLIDLIPLAEKAFRDEPKVSNAQTLSMLVNQVRELMADIMMETNRADFMEQLIADHLQPLFQNDIGQEILEGIMQVREIASKYVPATERKAVDKLIVDEMQIMLQGVQGHMRRRLSLIRESFQ